MPNPTPSTPISNDVKSVSSSTPIVPRPADIKPAPPESQQQPTTPVVTLGDLLEKFVSVQTLNDASSHFTHRGVCTKCGWQTYQLRNTDALTLVRQHVQQHWRDVSAGLAR